MATDAQLAAPPKKRALPFKRTVARKQQSIADPGIVGDDNDLDLFRHSKEVFSEILREAQEEKAPKPHDSKRRKVSRETSPARTNRQPSLHPSDEGPSLHRRSTTLDGSDDEVIMDVKGKGKEIIKANRTPKPKTPTSTRSSPRTPASKRTTPRTPASRRSTQRKLTYSPTTGATVIDDDDDDDDVRPVSSFTRQGKSTEHPTPRRHVIKRDEDDDDSPFEIPDDPDSEETEPAAAADNEEQPDEFSEWVAKAREMQAQSQQAIVNVFVTSRVPGAGPRPVLAKRRLNQDVQLLLKVWIAEQIRQDVVVPDEVANSLFLTWKGNKIYGLSTLASLGVQVDAQGRLRNEGEGYLQGGLLLEVWDEGTYAEYVESRGKERALMMLGDEEDPLAEGSEEEEEQLVQEKKKGIKIMLKAKDHETIKLMAREDTTVEAMIEAFRTQRGVGPEWEVAIYFDGERLDDDSMVKDADIDPDEANQLEVHLKPSSN